MAGVIFWSVARILTMASDNAAWDVSDADNIASYLGSIFMPQGSDGASSRVSTRHGLWLDYDCNATSLFVAMKTLVGHTFFGAAGDLDIRVNVTRY